MINVTKTFLPPLEEYVALLSQAWEKNWITNNGPFVVELEMKLKEYFGVKNLWFCNNGTSVLQMAIKGLDLTGEIITTPFSYVATTTAILWEKCVPVYVDIIEGNFCIDPSKIESKISEKTQAILATHVYGHPCNVSAIEMIAKKHNLKIIYDAAHAFGTKINGRSLLSYGDIITCSFHATKLFHTVEGGCIIANDFEMSQKLLQYRQFGHKGDDYISIGINAKNSEIHAAMGLCNFKYIDQIINSRKKQWLFYRSALDKSNLEFLQVGEEVEYNYSYFPVVFPTESDLIYAINELYEGEIIPRRYFFPALNTLPYINYQSCPIAESIAKRVLCLPLFYGLTECEQTKISNIILELHKQEQK
jgi:dTDP-4-amino-4,6-dideoxygalactose transaminase